MTFNDVDTYDYFRDSLVDVADDDDYDPTDREQAKDAITDADREYMGVLYQDENSVPYNERHGVEANKADIPEGAPEGAMDLVREFY